MEHNYSYFKRDISWLSFNYRVLMEADDDSLPLYERINFIAIYSSNLEEFYKVRVAEHRAVASGGHSDDMTPAEAHELIRQITSEVNIQLEDRIRIYDQKLIPALRRQHIIFYQSRSELEAPHQDYISGFFQEEIFPYLQPVPVCRQCINTFLRDNRLYLAARLRRKDTGALEYFIL
jgi:polyphosphate kinase